MERYPSDEILRRLAFGRYTGSLGDRPGRGPLVQTVPINVYETDEDVVIVAPMPGVEAENIDIEVHGRTVSLRASLRGPGQEHRDYMLHEWSYGPYERSVTLPVDVDGAHANASHGNGVLVVSLPKAHQARRVKVSLQQVSSSEARHEGHRGHHTTREGLEDAR